MVSGVPNMLCVTREGEGWERGRDGGKIHGGEG